MKYLKRNAYEELLAWKKRTHHTTLEISGARQVGKTYLVNKFADEQYQKKIYINLLDMSGELFLEQYKQLWNELKKGEIFENPVYELIKRHCPDFDDTPDTLVIIDEIQESADIYNRIREFTRKLKCDFIITGSYLGRILNKNFKFSSGDLDSLEIQTLNFEEFLAAFDKERLLESISLSGESEDIVYREMSHFYKLYGRIGGYPAVVLQYLKNNSIEGAQRELRKIIHLFIKESKRYFEDILDDAVYENLFSCIARILIKEKKGFDQDSFTEELQNIVVKDYSSNISKASVNRAIDWLYSAGIIGFAGKIEECNILSFKAKSRCYYMDLGIATYFLTKIGCANGDTAGIINENFVYLDLRKRLVPPEEIALETPAFATLGNGEIDFFVKGIKSQKTYALEVKAGKKNSKTIQRIKERKKTDFILFAKGNTKGGQTENIYTIPIYAISKFKF